MFIKIIKTLIMKAISFKRSGWLMAAFCSLMIMTGCQKEISLEDEKATGASGNGSTNSSAASGQSVVLVIDEESIDNGNKPNDFSETDVNDPLAEPGQRRTLRYFRENEGREIDLYAGEVGDEGWFALKTIPSSWISAGPTGNGTMNFLKAGPGLGGGEDNKEILLDKVPNVTPLRARGLKMLTGSTILAVVYDGDVSINYGPLNGNLQGANLGLVALEVLNVTRRTDGSSGSLPKLRVRIRSVEAAMAAPLKLFNNAPVPRSSSEPFDVNPPANIPSLTVSDAR